MIEPLFVAAPANSLAGDPLLTLANNAMIAEVFLASIAITCALFANASLQRSLGFAPNRLPVVDVIVLCVGTLALSHGLDGALAHSGWLEHSILSELPEQLEGASGRRLLIAVVALALFPAFAEEMLCRGILQRTLVRRFGASIGILGSSLFFGALHIDPIHALVATGLGVYLGLIAHWAGSIWPAIVCHGVNNALAVVASAQGGTGEESLVSIFIAVAVSTSALVWAFARSRERGSPLGT